MEQIKIYIGNSITSEQYDAIILDIGCSVHNDHVEKSFYIVVSKKSEDLVRMQLKDIFTSK